MLRVRLLLVAAFCGILTDSVVSAQTQDERTTIELTAEVRANCLRVLREGLHSDEFWPSIHAAEGLTLGGYGAEVIEFLEPKVPLEKDDQQRCGLARELIRAGLKQYETVMFEILSGEDNYGHIHAAESLYKVYRLGDGKAMRAAFAQTDSLRLQIMSAAALARAGNPHAMEFLRETLPHPDPETSRTVAWVLGRIGDARDVEPIRKLVPDASDEFTKSYYEHSLAALGDPAGLKALERNLSSTDGPIRTYAATFAGDAWATHLKDKLIGNLDDEHLDARIRAAQSLLQMAYKLPVDPAEDIAELVYRADQERPRYTEGSILEFSDGSLLYAVSQFIGSGSDFSQAIIVGRHSQDGGRTWGDP